MSDKGWAVIDRSIMDHWVWSDRPFSKGQAWIDLVLLANHEDHRFVSGGKVIDGKRGVVYRSVKSLADRWGWDRKKATRFLVSLERDGMVTSNSTTQGTTITIVNYGKYQDLGTTNGASNGTGDGTTSGQRMGQRWDNDGTTMGQRLPTNNHYNHDNHYNQDIGIGYNYTSLDVGVVGEAPQPTYSQYQEISELWNQIPHTINIREIVPGTQRDSELRVVLSMYGMDGVKEAIQRVKDSAFLQRRGHVSWDHFMNRNAIQKLLEGSYDVDYKQTTGGYNGELGIDWEAAECDSYQLSEV